MAFYRTTQQNRLKEKCKSTHSQQHWLMIKMEIWKYGKKDVPQWHSHYSSFYIQIEGNKRNFNTMIMTVKRVAKCHGREDSRKWRLRDSAHSLTHTHTIRARPAVPWHPIHSRPLQCRDAQSSLLQILIRWPQHAQKKPHRHWVIQPLQIYRYFWGHQRPSTHARHTHERKWHAVRHKFYNLMRVVVAGSCYAQCSIWHVMTYLMVCWLFFRQLGASHSQLFFSNFQHNFQVNMQTSHRRCSFIFTKQSQKEELTGVFFLFFFLFLLL